MNILFVDDDTLVLEGIERALFDAPESWRVHTAVGGAEGLALLERVEVDVVVSDMRMPDMDGAAFLDTVRRSRPGATRVVLSGQMGIGAAIRAAPIAHQFATKPCSGEEMLAMLGRIEQVRRFASDSALHDLVGSVSKLPIVPHTYQRLLDELGRDPETIDGVVSIIESEPAMAAQVLKLVNSSFFRRSVPTTCVGHAVAALGLDTLSRLVLATDVFESAKTLGPAMAARARRLQEHSMRVARLAREIAEELGGGGDTAYVAGLLHDIGVLVLAACAPKLERAKVRLDSKGRLASLEDEERLFGTTHDRVGAMLLGSWGLPLPIVEAVAFHHQQGAVASLRPSAATFAVHAASALLSGSAPFPEAVARWQCAERLTTWRRLAHGQ